MLTAAMPTDAVQADSPPAAPRDLAAVVRSGIRLVFTDASVDEQQFLIERSEGTGAFREIATAPGSPPGVSGERVFFDDTAAILGHTYVYRVRAANAAGMSGPSNEARATVGSFHGGFGAEYFNERFFAGPALYAPGEQDALQYWGNGSPDPRIDPGTFSAVYEGIVRPEFDETYTFHAASADGIGLTLIDAETGQVLIDYDNLAAERQWSYDDGFQDVAGSAPLQAWHPYFLRVRYNENAGEAGFRVGWSSPSTPLETLPAELIFPPVTPGGPKIDDVSIAGSTWSDAFVQRLAQDDPASAASGFRVSRGATQLAPLPWVNADRITMRFDRAVRIDRNDLTVSGAGGDYVVQDFAPAGPTWSLPRPIGADRVRLLLNADKATGGVVGIPDGGQALDGEWVDGASQVSGDGREGGDFRFAFNVVPGDVDRSGAVNALDVADVKRRLGSTTAKDAGAGYSVFADVNGDGRINALDLAAVKANLGTSLPQPRATAAPAAGDTPSPTTCPRLSRCCRGAGAFRVNTAGACA